ncbi:hypothetical protein BCV70DRAFT_200018 [Testicularia cyperi]|uniref:Secreted protein n=1 Tax=Testicularia cyperi TaxID=1882483 RepID=A0A317XR32_9BASI|nr:hypothetical protein BCV70DRAFT_200018 [Testicularia cyperi]
MAPGRVFPLSLPFVWLQASQASHVLDGTDPLPDLPAFKCTKVPRPLLLEPVLPTCQSGRDQRSYYHQPHQPRFVFFPFHSFRVVAHSVTILGATLQ